MSAELAIRQIDKANALREKNFKKNNAVGKVSISISLPM